MWKDIKLRTSKFVQLSKIIQLGGLLGVFR